MTPVAVAVSTAIQIINPDPTTGLSDSERALFSARMPLVPTDRTPPQVPNHEMLRVIGRGSYGEIWLARSVTGTLRAVKIIDRRTFDSEKAFQREFEGITRFEPISRSDAGFVDVLHVGRDPGGDFFYYVMELADDHVAGVEIDPEHYIPKTLKTELSRRARLLVDECVTLGLTLTRALATLHRQGLVHRDIKPANIIFVGGSPKIADIGLVATTGQDSFVGTEGYVPPEGPGSVQADLYSLGKVLYEIAMGKDRLDFPAVSTRLDELPDKGALLQFNEVLLRACATDVSKRYARAEEMHEDLERLRDGREVVRREPRRWLLPLAVLILAAATAFAVHWARARVARGAVTIETDPAGAMVVLAGSMKYSPAQFSGLTPGRYVAHVMLRGHERVEVPLDVEPNRHARIPLLRLQRGHGAAEIQSQPPGATFEVRNGDEVVECGTAPATVADLLTGDYELVLRFEGRELREPLAITRGETTSKELEFGFGKLSVTSQPGGADIVVDGRRAGRAPLQLTLPEGGHEVVAKYRSWPEQRRSVEAGRGKSVESAFEFPPGTAKITSSPAGATIFRRGKEIGRTPLTLEDLEPGEVRYELKLEGYKSIEVTDVIKPGEQTFLGRRFLQRAGPQRGVRWENSLGMKFLPAGDILIAVWLTRVRDYETFCQVTGRARQVPDFPQDDNHPVVKVSWQDATDFCEWLTKKELDSEQLEEGQQYRLPSDAEWSMAAGLAHEGGATPEERDGKLREFPWGKQWPPPAGAGNYADNTLRRSGTPTIAGYHDGFAQTSPVGSFAPNRLGFYDMGGNVWQWCFDGYKGNGRFKDWGVLRGGSWANAAQGELRASYRNVVDRAERDVIYGFRCVLVPEPAR